MRDYSSLFLLSCVENSSRSSYLYPSTDASPELTSVSPVSILKVVVFPAPLTPNRPKH